MRDFETDKVTLKEEIEENEGTDLKD